MTETHEEESQEQQSHDNLPPRIRSSNYQALYINFTEFGVTPWDVHIMLGKVHGVGAQGFGIEEAAELIMSPQHAKAFLLALGANVSAWEKTYGVIELPSNALVRATGDETKDGKDSERVSSAEPQTTDIVVSHPRKKTR